MQANGTDEHERSSEQQSREKTFKQLGDNVLVDRDHGAVKYLKELVKHLGK
jgi:hypothetical protein